MPAQIRKVEYFYVMMDDRPGEAFHLLSRLASEEVNLLAFSATPTGPAHTQLIIFPESPDKLVRMAERTGCCKMFGPHRAFLIQGDDALAGLVEIHRKVYDANINVVTSSGVTDGRGGYGYVLHVRPEDYDSVCHILEV